MSWDCLSLREEVLEEFAAETVFELTVEYEARRLKEQGAYRPEDYRRKGVSTVRCAGCGGAFKAKRPDAKWCSDRCSKRHHHGHRALALETVRKCVVCGSEFRAARARACSRKCRRKAAA